MSDKQEYYCEKCGSKVPFDADQCPSCGRLFYAVRCPNCDYTGKAEQFVNGCPICGYHLSGKDRPRGRERENTAPGGKRKERKWLYRLAAIILSIAIIVFFFIYFKM